MSGCNEKRGEKRPCLKRTLCVLLVICAFCPLTGCQKATEPRLPLPDEAAIAAALEKAGLPGTISEEETAIGSDGSVTYVVRDPAETYAEGGDHVFVAGVTAAAYEGERVLPITFDRSVGSREIKWEDWKRQLAFAAILFGDLTDDEEIYRAFAGNEVPPGQERCKWEAPLSTGYCVVRYAHRGNKTYGEDGFEVQHHSATLWVTLYESQELYRKLTEKKS